MMRGGVRSLLGSGTSIFRMSLSHLYVYIYKSFFCCCTLVTLTQLKYTSVYDQSQSQGEEMGRTQKAS